MAVYSAWDDSDVAPLPTVTEEQALYALAWLLTFALTVGTAWCLGWVVLRVLEWAGVGS
jgi:hypothetical protein